MPYLRAYRAEDEAEDGSMLFVASTGGVKRDGLEIDQTKWRLDNYARNPVVLMSHDYTSPPIGTADAYVEDGQLMARVRWDTADPQGAAIAGKYERGVMSAVSVGWDNVGESGERAKRGEDIAGHELLDISAVSVPGDPDALAVRMLRALRAELDDDEPEDEPEPERADEAEEDQRASAAAEMVALFVPGSDDDAERLARYKALVPQYRHAGLTPPPFRTSDELASMDARTWCGMWVSDELGRVGATLNARNKADVQAIRDTADGILKRSEKAKPEDNQSDNDERAMRALLGALNDEW